MAVLLLCTGCWPGCGTGAGDAFDRPVPEIGRGGSYDVPSLGHSAAAAREVADLRCTPRGRRTYGAHLEVFANRRDVVVPAGIGVAPPRRREGAYVSGGRCRYPLRTVEPTGLIEVEEGRRLTLGDFFDIWGQPLTRRRVLGFPVRPGSSVAVFVDGGNGEGPAVGPDRAPSRDRSGGRRILPPTRKYLFPNGL